MATVLHFAWGGEEYQVLYERLMYMYKYSTRIYRYSMRFKVPALDHSECSICYNYDLNSILALFKKYAFSELNHIQ